MSRFNTICAGLMLALATPTVTAQVKLSDGSIKIGVLTDLSGLYAEIGGPGAVEAVRMAAADFMKENPAIKVEVLAADHQNKADVAAARTRDWLDVQKVDMITDLVNSGSALATVKVAAERKRIVIVNGAASTRLTNQDCTPYSVHYAYDATALANGAGKYIVRNGGDSWYFVTSDNAFGQSLEKEVAEIVSANGGKVLGSSRHPLGSQDMTSLLLKAQSSRAKIIGLANAGGDAIHTIKAAYDFGLISFGKQKLAGLLVFLTDVHALGLEATQGMFVTDGFYWNMNEQTRKWSARYAERMNRPPTMVQAADYSSTMHYLNAVKAAGTDEADAVMRQMRAIPVNDFFAKNGVLRADGRFVHDMYLMEVKSPGNSKMPWDYYSIVATIPGDEAFIPLSRSACPLLAK
ncbi:MAG: ABC transporter substrate-binding protein [Rhodocyclaceae bacterium]|nr:ABC transporter substrate-binding protein [Rhodocyclaceae bacterium]MBX3668911.1 ABC transporter substrate-binding protein [Rhodocyclaceae bacterium]